ncbi:MAG TPA: serpin family protein [candidate division WOR-3 bacterium]|uniref:Serpin family protein n=1 Tax=candidate division WOR-3 bacterium TaxID=2052148 RepID=A0A7V0T6W7_UNCW3|nr:serpin family protein [candidate division WOR-3 bacterium]
MYRAIVLAVILLTAGCAASPRPVADQAEPDNEPPAEPVPAELLVEAGNRFGIRLFGELYAEAPEKNVFISPPSIALALAMAWNGARGETREAMAAALDLAGLEPAGVGAGHAVLLAAMPTGEGDVTLEIANSLWSRRGFPFAERYLKTVAGQYDARLAELDFGSPEAVETINRWVRDRTRGRIEDIISRLNPDDVLVLLNAVYFKGAWTDAFEPGLTAEREFTGAAGKVQRGMMMARDGDFRYRAGDGFQMARLPYGEGDIAMYLLLPEQSGAPAADRLTAEEITRWAGEMRTMKGEVVLPRFKLEYARRLNDPLKRLGMDAAFDPARADFGGMVAPDAGFSLFISEVMHKSFVEVNEEGTEAAAATSVTVTLTSMPPREERFRMVCDRPFIYLIRDDRTGALLFLGVLNELP